MKFSINAKAVRFGDSQSIDLLAQVACYKDALATCSAAAIFWLAKLKQNLADDQVGFDKLKMICPEMADLVSNHPDERHTGGYCHCQVAHL